VKQTSEHQQERTVDFPIDLIRLLGKCLSGPRKQIDRSPRQHAALLNFISAKRNYFAPGWIEEVIAVLPITCARDEDRLRGHRLTIRRPDELSSPGTHQHANSGERGANDSRTVLSYPCRNTLEPKEGSRKPCSIAQTAACVRFCELVFRRIVLR
jgi:hypothetical protein